MVVAAADFYTYARATGTPLPENKKEEAELVPAINQWKRNQLRQQRQEDNDINGGAIAAVAGLAGLGAAALAASRGGLRNRVTNAVDPTSGSRISTGIGGLQQDLNEKVTQSSNWDDYKDSIALKTKVNEKDFVNEALDKVERDAIRESSIADYTPQELAALEQVTPRVSKKVRRANIQEGGEKVRQNMIRGLELPEPSWEQTSVVQNRQPEVRAISPKEVLALPSAITDEGYTAPQKTWSEYRYAGPDALESLADEQLDIIRGTSPTGGSARENAERSAELNRQAQMRRRLPEEGGQKVLRDLFAKPQVVDPWDTPAVTNNNVDSPITTNDFLQKEGPGKYIDPELVTNSSAGNVPKSTTTQDQAISAINSAEDQDTGRIRDAIVKNPNIDTSNLDDANLQNISQNLPVTQEEQRVGIAKPKFYEGRNIDLQRVSNTKPLNTGTFLDTFVGNLPAGIVLADEIARRGVTDIGDVLKGAQQKIFYNADGSVKSVPQFIPGGQALLDDVKRQEKELLGMKFPEQTLNTPQELLDQTKLKAAAAIENRKLQLQRDTNLDPRSTRFDNALAREWATKPNIDPSIVSEDFRKTVQAPKDVEDFISTEIPETDASNVAKFYYNEDTGNMETVGSGKTRRAVIRDTYKEKVVPSEDIYKPASDTSIRGQSRSLDIQEPKIRTRTDEFTGDISPDTPGGLTGFPRGPRPRGVQLSTEARDQPVTLANPTGKGIIAVRGTPIQTESLPLNQRAPRTQVKSLLEGEVERIDDYANQGGGAGMGVYGRQLGYVAGPESKTVTGLRSTGLRAKPTDVPETKKGREFNPQTKRDEFRDLSNDTLRKIITQGTYRSGKMGRTAREAQYELKLRKDLGGKAAENYAPNIEKAKKSMEVSRDIQNIYNSGRPDAQQRVQAYIQGLRKGQQF